MLCCVLLPYRVSTVMLRDIAVWFLRGEMLDRVGPYQTIVQWDLASLL
jgi:hypothetical protein